MFLLALLLLGLFMSGVLKKKKSAPIYVDADGRDNIMPYNDEGKDMTNTRLNLATEEEISLPTLISV